MFCKPHPTMPEVLLSLEYLQTSQASSLYETLKFAYGIKNWIIKDPYYWPSARGTHRWMTVGFHGRCPAQSDSIPETVSISCVIMRNVRKGSPVARLPKIYDDTIQRYRNSHAKIEYTKMHILRSVGQKFSCKNSKVSFDILHKILNPYTTKYAFYKVLKIRRFMISQSYES